MKATERKRAIAFRKQGKSYREILKQVPVAKSTLSLWLRSVGLAIPQVQRLTKKRIDAGRRGALRRHVDRMQQVNELIRQGKKDVAKIKARELWLIGVALYWAEGSKQNESSSVSAGIMFGNSDVRMIQIFLLWLRMMRIQESRIFFELYIHDNRRDEVPQFKRWWSRRLKISHARISRVYFKRDKPLTNRTNTKDLYHGLLRIKVTASTILNRKVSGWVEGIVAALGGGVIGNTSAFGAEDSRFDP